MESETKPNKAHHENGQKESLDPAKIAPTKSEDQSTLRVDDFHLKVSLKTVSARRVLFSDRG
jgi:hypothetical protein